MAFHSLSNVNHVNVDSQWDNYKAVLEERWSSLTGVICFFHPQDEISYFHLVLQGIWNLNLDSDVVSRAGLVV